MGVPFHRDALDPFPAGSGRHDAALFGNANVSSAREEGGRYLWALWEKGATLEAINWYVLERAKYNDHASMASEYPSDDIEAFVHSGTMVFDK